jgi:hypothetical protein
MLKPQGVAIETAFRLFGGLASMGKTVPSYRIALEWEIAHWKRFRNALPSEEQKQAFDDVMDICRTNAMAAQNACKPILFEPMVVSILLGHQKSIIELEKVIQNLSGKSSHG